MQIHRGKIKHFNGQYGFISYEKGEIYFHRTGLRVHGYISQGEEVEFKIESSPIIKDKFQAFDIALIEINLESIIETYLIGQIDWFEFEKGYGIIIGPDNKEYFLHISKYQGDKKFLAEKNFYVFEGEEKDGRLYAVNCRYADKKLLTSYLNAKKTIVSEYPEFYFSIWIKGFIDDKDIEYISSKLSNNTFGWELYRTIFKRVSNPIEQKLLLYKFLERVLIIDTKEKYENVKIIAQLIELNKEVKLWFIKEIENKANEEIKFLLWLEGYTNDKDLKYIEIMVSIGLGAKSFNLIMKIFKRLSDPNEQIELLISVFDSLDDDEASSKYQKIKYLFDLDGVSENVDTSIKQYVYMKSDEEVKLLMWLDNYTELVDINCLAKRLAQENIHFVSRKIDFIFNMITGMEEQRELLHYFLKGLVDLVGNEDYEKVKLLSGHLNLNESIKSNFLNDAYKIASDQIKYLMWFEGFSPKKDLQYVAKRLTQVGLDNFQINPFKVVFERLLDPAEQNTVLNNFLAVIEDFDNEEKYMRFKYIVNRSEIDKEVKSKFIISSFIRADAERKFLMWLDGFTLEKDLEYISLKLKSSNFNHYTKSNIENIFKRLQDPSEQYTVLKNFLYESGEIDGPAMYEAILLLSRITELDENVNRKFLDDSYNQADQQYKFWMVLDGLSLNTDLELICNQLPNALEYNYSKVIKKIFNVISEPTQQKIILNKISLFLEDILDDEKQYYYNLTEKIRIIENLNEISKDVKNDFLRLLLDNASPIIMTKLYLDFWQDRDGWENISFNDIFDKLDIATYYDFCYKLVDPLSIINNRFPHKGLSYLKIFLTSPDFFKYSNGIYEPAVTFFYKNTFLIEQRFRNRLVTFNIIQESIDKNLLKIENIEKEFIVNNSYDEVSNFLKTRRMFYSAYDQIQKDLGEITQYKHPDIEGVILERTNMTQIVRYWLYDLIDYFDFNKFSYYYFTLNIEERKLFNKKVKAKMGEEIKSSLLRQREPWRFVKGIEDADITYTEIYAATWKSIWFDNGFIRICTGKNAEFSSPYYWDFSEEKFNLLYDYILGRRLNELKISVSKGRINLIDGLDDLEEVIWKILIFKEAESSDGYVIKGIGQNRIPVNMILRNQCVKFLNKLQIKDLVPTRILEKTLNITKGGINIDISLLYSIPINNFEIAIIWESLELEKSKATHIFKCNKSEYSKVFSEIEHFLTSNIKVRSALNSKNSKDSKTQKILRYLCRIEHDNFNYQKWENSLLEVLPEIKVT